MILIPLVVSMASFANIPFSKFLPNGAATASLDFTRTAFSSTSGNTTGFYFVEELLTDTPLPNEDPEEPVVGVTDINDENGIGKRASVSAFVPGGCVTGSATPWINIGNNTGQTQSNIQAAYKIRAHGQIAGYFPTSGYAGSSISMQSNTATGSKNGQGMITPALTYNDSKTFVITIMTLAPDAAVEYYGSGSLDAIAN
ncbi:hypothetical protein [Armatimonas sp.]|uniref:hypothetical protein n=1 Tax=Armatimonas sp. TaxID=1872638 RepID=UPI00286A6027|nr:hypothetical protein [Armatimonas sp.]